MSTALALPRGVLLTLLAACGARTDLSTSRASDAGASTGGTCQGDALVLAASSTVDAPQMDSEPESAPRLAWTGSELLVAWTRWTPDPYFYVVDPIHLYPDHLDVAPETTIGVGNSSNPFILSTVWDGSTLALFWAQDDGSILLQHFGPDGATTGAMAKIVVAPTNSQTIPSDVIALGGGYLFTWFVQSSTGWQTFAGPFTHDGAPTATQTLLYAGGGYDYGAQLATMGGSVFALWSMNPANMPMTPVDTVVVSLDPATGAVRTMSTVDQGVDYDPASLATEPRAGRLDIATWLPDTSSALLLGGSVGGPFVTRATIDGATSAPSIAVDDCGRLVVLTPRGQMTPDNPLPTGLTLQLVAGDGTLGPAVTLPVGSSYLETYDLVAVAGGFAVGWVEGGAASSSPGRSLHVAFVRVQ